MQTTSLSTSKALQQKTKKLTAQTFDSGFPDAHDTYNAISVASDGNVYYVLSSDKYNVPGRMYMFNPASQQTKFLADLNDICGEDAKTTIVQGKSHVRFYEYNGKLYFSTHVGFYELIDGMDRLPETPPNGYGLYPGGHFLSYDLKTGDFEDLGVIPNGEGAVAMTMDQQRGQLFAISWPTGNFIHFDVNTGELRDLGPTSGRGEAGTPGTDFRSLCRSMLVDPATGYAYFSTSEGDIFCYKPVDAFLEKMERVNLRLDYFGDYDPAFPGSMGYNWRKIFWHTDHKIAYGVHGNSGYLFQFDPKQQNLELMERLTSIPSRKSGMYDQFSYGYLGFILGPDQQTIYYLTGGPVYEDGKRIAGVAEIAKGAAKGIENLHLITYNIAKNEYNDQGPIFYENGERPLYVNAIAIGHDGTIYSLARINRRGREITDLISIKNPLL